MYNVCIEFMSFKKFTFQWTPTRGGISRSIKSSTPETVSPHHDGTIGCYMLSYSDDLSFK